MKTFKELMEEKVITENLEEIQEMAYTDVQIVCDNAKRIMEMMDEGIEPESWNYSKITMAADYLTSVYTAMRAKKSEMPSYDSYYEEVNLDESNRNEFRTKLIQRAIIEYADGKKDIRGILLDKITDAFASKKNFGTKAQDELESELGLPIGIIKSLVKEVQSELKANMSASTSSQTQAQRVDRYLKQKWVK